MDKFEELQASFEAEINEFSEREIVAVENEIEDIRMRTMKEIEGVAKRDADLFYDQEIAEIDADHAIALSHVNDDFNRKLMSERDQLVEQVFTEAKKQVIAFADDADYADKVKQKLRNLKSKNLTPAKLYVRPADEKLLPSFLKSYELACDGELDATITYGGFRLVCSSRGIIVDETYDTAMQEATQWFLQNSGLTIR